MSERVFSVYKGAVTDEAFIGREEELAFLMRHADADRPVHVSVYGLPHVGKTSLLKEWTRRLKENGGQTPSGRRLCILSGGELNAYSEYTEVINSFYYNIASFSAACGNADLGSLAESLKAMGGYPSFTDAGEATEQLRDAIRKVNACGFRVVLSLDEFEFASDERLWPEGSYRKFCSLLLDESLDLFCVIASRPHISYIIGKHCCKIIPFEPFLLRSFSDEDMTEYLKELSAAGGPDLLAESSGEDLMRLLTACGKNPYLLSFTAKQILEKPASVKETLKTLHRSITDHYAQVVSFMLEEEKKEQKSFTHVIKCYFGTSDDYGDIIDTYIRLGYIEEEAPEGRFAAAYKRYARYDKKDTVICYYTTVCPGFINYLYTHELDQIRDIRDLLTGLIHALRYITEEELAAIYPPPLRWHEELLKRFEGKTDYAELRNDKWFSTPRERIGSERKSWIDAHQNEMITVSDPSLRFAVQELLRGGKGRQMAVLDAISLTDHAAILCAYPEHFADYFGILGDLRSDIWARKALKDLLEDIQKNIRNPISHYSRRSKTKKDMESRKSSCIDLLRSIYSFYADGVVAEKL